MTDDMIIGYDRIFSKFVTLKDYKLTMKSLPGCRVEFYLREILIKFLYDPYTGKKVCWDEIEMKK